MLLRPGIERSATADRGHELEVAQRVQQLRSWSEQLFGMMSLDFPIEAFIVSSA